MAKNAFSCRIYVKKGFSVVEITGDVTFETVEVLRLEFSSLRLSRPSQILLDCSKVTLLSSVGLGEFSRLMKWGLDNNVRFGVVCQNAPVVEVLEIAGITDMVKLYPTLDLAIGYLQ
jgi:anti-anti-sigma factor